MNRKIYVVGNMSVGFPTLKAAREAKKQIPYPVKIHVVRVKRRVR